MCRSLSFIGIWALAAAAHLLEEPMRVLVQSGLGHEVLQVVTALLQTIGAKMWKKKILKEAPNSGARGHELFGTGICLEDFVGNINFILDGRELGPHVGAAESAFGARLLLQWAPAGYLRHS